MNDGTLTPTALAMQSLCRALVFDMSRLIPSEYYSRDLDYLLGRLTQEGEQFLFMTLPLLGKAIDKALILEEPLQVPLGWRLRKNTRLPLLLFHLFSQVFDEKGQPLEPTDNSRTAVLLLRQLCFLWSKVERCTDPILDERTISEFKKRTENRESFKGHPCLPLARELIGRVISGDGPLAMELRRFQKNPWGRHGPGAVADKSSPSEKWQFNHWPGLRKELFSFSSTSNCESSPLDTQPDARVITVPKDFRGPRVICIEPKENQFAQQGLMDILYRLLPSHPLTGSAIQFIDTSVSEKLCYRRDVCTIDLKDASDRLSISLARVLFPGWFFSLVTRYRTRHISYKDIRWRPYCLATMGNACCFPLQTLVFWAIAKSTMLLEGWKRNIHSFKPLRVFGDDIIVPQWASKEVILALEGCGLMVNNEKTCLHNLVKESCGEWVYAGKSSRVVKLRSAIVRDQLSWLQWKDYSVLLYRLGFIATAAAMMDSLRTFLPPSSIRARWNVRLQRKEFRVPVLASTGPRAELPGNVGLYAWHVRNDTAPFLSGTWKRVKMRWVSDNPYENTDGN